MEKWFKDWFKRFWNYHGDRVIFTSLSLTIALVLFFFVPDMKEESKTVIVGIMMLLYNYARSNKENTKKEDYQNDLQLVVKKTIEEIKKDNDEKKEK